MNLNETAKTALENSLKRQHNGANIRVADILKHCAGEVVEAEEAFILWKYEAHARKHTRRNWLILLFVH